jgi:hypothetical protein
VLVMREIIIILIIFISFSEEGYLVTGPETANSADLGGSSKYSSETLED